MSKRITLALAALGLSATAFAGHPGDEMPLPVSNDINLTAPYQDGMWSFGVEALYWETGSNNLHYVTSSVTTAGETILHTSSVDPEYAWGWRADIAYHFPGNGRDVTLSYTQLDNNNSGAVDNTAENTLSPIAELGGSGIETFTSAQGKSSDDYDAVDLTFGQKIDVGQRVRLHPFAGLRYTDIDNTDKITYEGTSATGGITTLHTTNSRIKSEFQGVGPRFGSDAQVNLGGGFMVVGRVGMSLLIGDKDEKFSSTQFTADSSGLVSPTTISISDNTSSNTRVVPELDARLGIAYAYNWHNGTGLGVEAGWEATNYFNAVDDSLIGFVDTSSHEADFSMQGPYLRVQLDIA